ncbi:MAG TPA: methyltransferase domain-containing protein [Anaeromyxobacter sp.]|nr:methyltransferase domain-containing protein [Anaeromyxobacter sp.]
MSWTDAYYGPLYLDSVADLLTPELSALEAAVIARLLALRPEHRVLDLACGHGRHARVLAGGVAVLVGLDRSRPYLDRARASSGAWSPPPRYVHGDLRALPFADGAFDAVYSWYSALFMWDDAGNAAALGALARVVRAGGRALVHHANPLRLAAEPVAHARRTLADGAVVEEEARFDAATGLETARRRLARPDGTALEGTASLRYYGPDEWGQLARGAGLRVVELTSTTGLSPGTAAAPDVIAVLERP